MPQTLSEKLIWVGAIYAALTLLQLLLRRTRPFRKAAVALNILFLGWCGYLFFSDWLAPQHPQANRITLAILLFLSAYVGVRLLDVWLVELVIERRRQAPVPVVLRDIGRWLLYAVFLFLILRTVFPTLNLNVLAVSSIVIGYILGNATQDTLGNLIAGLALNTEHPFSIGDWVQAGGHVGQIVDMTWRATRLRTKMDDFVVIPNAMIAREPILNYSRPTRCHGTTFQVGASYDVPPNKVRAVILDVLAGAPGVLAKPSPRIYLSAYGDSSVNFTVKFFSDDFENLDTIQSDVMYRIWYAFRRAKINIPYPIRDIRMQQAQEPGKPTASPDARLLRADILWRIPLLQPLSPAERAAVARELREDLYAAGETLVREGEEGDTFYVVTEGGVEISVGNADKRQVVAHLSVGDFFGEMSLLTGEKRNATVTAASDVKVLCLSHAVLKPLLEANSGLAAELAGILEQRARQRAQAVAAGAAAHEAPPTTRAVILGRIRRFFGLSADA